MANDDVDIGILVRDSGSAAVIDGVRTRLEALRAELSGIANDRSAFEPLDPTVAASVDVLSSDINVAIGSFQRMAQEIDTTSAQAVVALRAQGDALAANLVSLGASDAELNVIGATVARVEKEYGAFTAELALNESVYSSSKAVIAKHAEALEFDAGATVAATTATRGHTLQLGRLTMEAGTATGRLLGVSTILTRTSALIGANVAGFLPVIAILAAITAIGVAWEKVTGNTKEAAKAAEDFEKTTEAIKATNEALGSLKVAGVDVGALQAVSKQAQSTSLVVQKLRQELADMTRGTHTEREQAARTPERAATFAAVQQLAQQLLTTNFTAEQLDVALAAIPKNKKFDFLVADIAKVGAQLIAARQEFEKQTAVVNLADAQLRFYRGTLQAVSVAEGELLEKTQQSQAVLDAFRRGGAGAAKQQQDDNAALQSAKKIYDDYAVGAGAAKFGQIAFQDALKSTDPEVRKFAQSLVVEEKALSNTNAALSVAQRAAEEQRKAAVSAADRNQGPAAAARIAADHDLKVQVDAINAQAGVRIDKNRLIEALQHEHDDKIFAIDRDAAQKLNDMLTRFDDERLAGENKFAADQFGVQRAAVQRQLDLNLKAIAADRDIQGPDKTTARARAQAAATASIEAIEKDRAKRILEINVDLQAQLDQISGTLPDADKIRNRYKTEIDVLTAAIQSNVTTPAVKAAAQKGIDLINALIPAEQAQARFDRITSDLSSSLDQQQQVIDRVQGLQAAHAISDDEARSRTLVALAAQRNLVAQAIVQLQQESDLLPGNQADLAKIEALKTQLQSLDITIAQTSDTLFQLKEGARDAFTNGLAQLLDESAKGAKSLKDIWIDVATGIVDSLRQIATQMLANLIIQNLLGFFKQTGTAASGVQTGLALAGTFAAEGGVIRGPGTGTSDSIPAWLSDGEGILTARTTAHFGGARFINALNSIGEQRTPRSRNRTTRFAGGGLVTGQSNVADQSFHGTLGLEEGLVLKHLDSDAGERIILKTLSRNGNKLRSVLGNR